MDENRIGDFRLYCYTSYGTLTKIGANRTDKHKIKKHYFQTLKEIREHIQWLFGKNLYYMRQLVVIEYYKDVKVNSKIMEVIEKPSS